MDSCGVLIVGGGPAGSSCARRLRKAGIDSIILDRCNFPRHKVCGGWITPAVVEELEIDLEDYARGRVLQPITGFRTSMMGHAETDSVYGRAISYGIRRLEFDDYLMHRSGARLMLGTPFRTMERVNGGWRINGEIDAQVVVGAGGHFCPVAKQLSGSTRQAEPAVVAQEVEFEMSPEQRARCSIRGEVPELYFCADMKGYGWCFRKGDFLNIGLGRQDQHQLSRHVSEFAGFLRSTGKIGFDLPSPMLGHAYLLYGESKRRVAGDGFLLIGDAAGLAYAQSGEGIRPAIESGLLAADTLIAANGDYIGDRLNSYQEALAQRFGGVQTDWCSRIAGYLPAQGVQSLARMLLETRWFSRHIVLDRWFLHSHLPALPA